MSDNLIYRLTIQSKQYADYDMVPVMRKDLNDLLIMVGKQHGDEPDWKVAMGRIHQLLAPADKTFDELIKAAMHADDLAREFIE